MKEGWTYKKLGDVCNINSGKSIKSSLIHSERKEGFSPCYGGNGLRGYVEMPNCNGGNPIIGRVGAQCGNVHYCDSPFYATEHALIVTLLDKTINPLWLCHLFSSMDLKQYAEGAAQPVIAARKLLSLNVSIPPMSVQQRIVERLDAAFENIDKLKANAEKQLAEAQTLFQKSLAKAMEPKEGWEEKTLKEIVLTITDGDHQPPPKSNEGIPFITISNINKDSNKIDFEDTFYVPQHYFDGLKTDRIPQEGDVLYTVTGSFGIPVLIDYKKDFCFQRHIALIRPNQKMLFSKYLYYWILSDYAKVQAEDTATGAAQRTVSLNSLRKFRISIPPLAEQQRIVERLDALSENIRKYEEIQRQIISECDALKQALLRKVFE